MYVVKALTKPTHILTELTKIPYYQITQQLVEFTISPNLHCASKCPCCSTIR